MKYHETGSETHENQSRSKEKHKNFRQDEEMSCRNQEQPISNSRAEKHDPAQEQEKGVRATSVKKV